MANHEFLKKITLVPGVSGFEKQATRVMKDYLTDCVDEFQYDNLGSLVAIKKGTGNLKVLMAGHIDEIGFVVKGIEKRMHASKRLQAHIVIENDHKNEAVKVLDVANPDNMSQEEVFNAIKELGLVGLGGSGFPTYIKYNNPQNIETILINGVECEPFLTCDHLVMKRDIKALFDGVNYLIKAANAKNAIIAIKEHKPDLFELLVEEAKNYENIEPREVPDRYPMGWERVLVETVFKKEYDKLVKNLRGIREMKRMPQAMVIVDPRKEEIAIKEARILGIPVFGIVDTNCDPDMVDYVIPGNDDAVRSVKLLIGVLTNAIAEVNGNEVIDYISEDDKVKGEEVEICGMRECAKFLGCVESTVYNYQDSEKPYNGWLITIKGMCECQEKKIPLQNNTIKRIHYKEKNWKYHKDGFARYIVIEERERPWPLPLRYSSSSQSCANSPPAPPVWTNSTLSSGL